MFQAVSDLRQALAALAAPEPDTPLYGNPQATAVWDAWNRARIAALKRRAVADPAAAELVRLRRTVEAIHRNARSYHALEYGKQSALNVIGNWAEDALAGRLNPIVEKLTNAGASSVEAESSTIGPES